MSEIAENGGTMADTQPDAPVEKMPVKASAIQENGIDKGEEKAGSVSPKPVNGTGANHVDEDSLDLAEDGAEDSLNKPNAKDDGEEDNDGKEEEDMSVDGDAMLETAEHVVKVSDGDTSVVSIDSVRSVDTPVVLSDNGDGDNVESINTSSVGSPVTIDSNDPEISEDSQESLDSKDSAEDDAAKLGGNDSQNPSIVSEEDSRDSINSMGSGKSDDVNSNLVESVNDDEEGEFTITLNENEEDEADSKKGENDSPTKSEKLENDSEKNENIEEKQDSTKESETVKPDASKSSEIPAPPPLQQAPGVSVAPKVAAGDTVSLPNRSVALTLPGVPAGAQIAQQGNQLGYITHVGKQTLFVPINMPTSVAANSTAVLNQLTGKPSPTAQPSPAVKRLTPEELKPKSSWEMMELMKWELQNRVTDNWNWSVAFHPKREELSSITAFLQELGSDVVKEQVYKDIIQIQTKKKQAGELKDPEVESLDKMKNVYENTKKKVEHLQLETLTCNKCAFKTESPLILEHHKDYPHYEPHWDINKGAMLCSLCNYRTRVAAQFVFHMQDIHKRQAKFPEKDQYFMCGQCPLNASNKSKLERHQSKCVKNFKLQVNLQPYYHDVNYCMKTCYYKPKKPIVKPPAPVKVQPRPATPVITRPQAQPSLLQGKPRPGMLQTAPRSVRPPVQNPGAAQMSRPAMPGVPQIRPQIAMQLQQQRLGKPGMKEMSGFEVCEMCGGYVKDRQALRIHFYYAHKVELPQAIFNRDNPPLTCEICKAKFWTTQGLTKHKTTQRHFSGQPNSGSSQNNNFVLNQQCFMCLRKVGNLFLHVEQIHGMTMRDLVLMKKCIICGITAVDRHSLEVHMASAHGVIIKASDYLNDKPAAPRKSNTAVPSGPKPGKNIGKINFCVFCEIQFSDNIQLTVHCMKKHATCKECGMVVPSIQHLAKHNCMKANRKCYICGLENMTPDSYASHLKRHVKPCKVKITNLTSDQIEDAKDKLKREYKPAVISLDSDEDSDVEVVETKPSRTAGSPRKARAAKPDVKQTAQGEKDEVKSEAKMDTDETDSKTESAKPENMEDKTTKEDSETSDALNENAATDSNDKDKKSETNLDKENSDETNNEHESDQTNTDSSVQAKKESDNSTDEANPAAVEKETEMNKVENNEVCVTKESNTSGTNGDAMNEDELLAGNEDSNQSDSSLKRKKPESDIDEDELLRDDNETKRQKLDGSEDGQETGIEQESEEADATYIKTDGAEEAGTEHSEMEAEENESQTENIDDQTENTDNSEDA